MRGMGAHVVCCDCGVGMETAGGVEVGTKGECGSDRLGRGGNGSNSSGDKGLELTNELEAEVSSYVLWKY